MAGDDFKLWAFDSAQTLVGIQASLAFHDGRWLLRGNRFAALAYPSRFDRLGDLIGATPR